MIIYKSAQDKYDNSQWNKISASPIKSHPASLATAGFKFVGLKLELVDVFWVFFCTKGCKFRGILCRRVPLAGLIDSLHDPAFPGDVLTITYSLCVCTIAKT